MTNNRLNPVIYYFLIAALLLRSLVPIGYMPDVSSGIFKITICTPGGAKTINWDSGSHPNNGNQTGKNICDFAGLISFSTLPVVEIVKIIPQIAVWSGVWQIEFIARFLNTQFQSRAPPISINQ
ncbi:MAG: hypothetical protein EYC62_06060 [Alphaproteobacteria bacterium]|nr:MAG: hypothetical protein EYC62_06060 [Alphaproteobacteria bacterium]